MYRADSRRLAIPETRFRHRAKPFEICVEQGDHWTCLFLKIISRIMLHVHLHSTVLIGRRRGKVWERA